MKTPKETVKKVADALLLAHPDLYPQPDWLILLDRILWARYLSPVAKFRVGREDDWFAGRWIHACTRDRRNVNELKRLWALGMREHEGKRIMGTASEPYTQRFDRQFVEEVFLDIESLPNLESLLSIP